MESNFQKIQNLRTVGFIELVSQPVSQPASQPVGHSVSQSVRRLFFLACMYRYYKFMLSVDLCVMP